MAEGRVDIQQTVAGSAARVWTVLGDFTAPWHPFIAEISAGRDEHGRLLRRFRAHGEDTLYVERLTYFSDSDRTLAYEHVAGIREADRYHARYSVEDLGEAACRVTWSASFSAPDHRIEGIRQGTEAVLKAGVAALEGAVPPEQQVVSLQEPDAGLSTTLIPGSPRLAATVSPPQAGPLLLFLHGIGGHSGNWARQQRWMAGHLQTAALDLRGYGDSELGPGRSRADDYCADILRVMAHLDKDQVILCGLSYGSWIATSFAMRHGGRLAGLVLSGGCTGMSEASEHERETFLKARLAPLDEGRTPADVAPDVVRLLAGPLATAAMRADMQAAMSAIPAATYRDALLCFTHPEERFDVSRITCPVMLMTGEHDRLASPGEIRAVAQRIHSQSPAPNVRFEVIAGAGHLCNIEAPERYAALLSQFLKGRAT